MMLCVPLWNKNTIHYLSIPLGYRMWQKKESKLELAVSMVRQVMPAFSRIKNVMVRSQKGIKVVKSCSRFINTPI